MVGMRFCTRSGRALIVLLLFCLEVQPVPAQRQAPKSAAATIRVGVTLVQTDVTVYDRQGRFVDDLRADQFQLQVDGRPQSVDSFELVTEGGPKEATTSTKATSQGTSPLKQTSTSPDAGRTLLFFLDDLHISADSMMRARNALLSLIDQNMGVNDRAAIFTASRQLGFLQQLSENKAVLRAAVARLAFVSESPRDFARPVMTESQAQALEQGDSDLWDYFVEQTVSATGLPLEMAREIVRGRAAALAHLSAEYSVRSLVSLGNIVQSCAALKGRKLLFFLSDGFVLQPQKEDVAYRLRLVAEAAARATIVIYALDTRGLMVALPNGSDPLGRLDRGNSEVLVSQDGLNALASDTGGRFFKNTNALDTAIVAGMEEAARYYLLGWYVDSSRLVPGRYNTIQITLKDRPDLNVHQRQGQMDLSKLIPRTQLRTPKAVPAKAKPNEELIQALQFPWPITELPVFLYAGYYYNPERGYILDISFQTEIEGPESAASTGKIDQIEIMGIVANREDDNVDKFKDNISQSADSSLPREPGRATFAAVRMVGVDPGIYQVRVAMRDPKSGRIGSAHQWVDVPRVDLLPSPDRKILLGSIFLRRKQIAGGGEIDVGHGPFDEQQFSAMRRYPAAQLPYFVQVYNAASPSITMQARLYRGNQVVFQSPSRSLAVSAAEAVVPFFVDGEVPLEGLSPGSYVLEVTATETSAKAFARQQVPFWIQAR